MHVSPEKHYHKMIEVFAKECAKNGWSVEEIDEKLENLRYGYVKDRWKLYEMNLEHDKNIESTGTCFCIDLRRKELMMLGHDEERIEEILRHTEPWGREDHIHVLCTRNPNSDNFKLYYRVMFFYGIHHSDLKRLQPTVEELLG